MAIKVSAKQLAIDKANATMFIVLAAASFIGVFSLVASKSLISQQSYHRKVIKGKEDALKISTKNLEEAGKLESSYKEFSLATTNVLGGNPKATGERDGENPRIVLDALPSKYDFPALLSSVEKVLTDNKFTLDALEGLDDEVAQGQTETSASPQPIDMPFTVTVKASGASAKPILDLFELSIRPIQVQQVIIKSDDVDQPKITVKAKSYYQPGKNFSVKLEKQR